MPRQNGRSTTAKASRSADARPGATIENLDKARFKCVFPSCGGVCCQNSRPGVTVGERQQIDRNLRRFLPHLRESARREVETRGWLTRRRKEGLRTIAVDGSWCVFFNEGCVLQKVGSAEGDAWKYKPSVCVRFPLDRSPDGAWYVRQWGYRDEGWDLFCLNPKETKTPARDSLSREIAFVEAREAKASRKARK